jgi:ADP-heptose:LPS heptosyltransferase
MKILIIQTAFIGDVVLATSLVDFIKKNISTSKIDFLLRKGNESLLKDHPQINNVLIWNKNKGKYLNLFKMAFDARKEKYDLVLNIQRFTSSGIFMALCGAKMKVGFKQNPLSFFFHHRINHKIPHFHDDTYYHEVQRNLQLLGPVIKDFKIPPPKELKPNIFLSEKNVEKIKELNHGDYIVLAPSSVWFTKQWDREKWIELTKVLSKSYKLYFIGGPDDKDFIESIILNAPNSQNLCGKLSLVDSAALMKNAKRVLVNDSAPLHLASSVNAKTTAIFCSTIPEFGYFPLSDDSELIQLNERLSCMPCGLHGKKSCPLEHFNCARNIDIQRVIDTI